MGSPGLEAGAGSPALLEGVALRQSFAERLRQLRHDRSMTQERLAEASGLSVDSVRRIERGAMAPSLDTIGRLGTGLQVSLPVLFASQSPGRATLLAELGDLLSGRAPEEVRLGLRVLRALFSSEAAHASAHGAR